MKTVILLTTLKVGSSEFLEKGSIFEEPFSKELELEIKKRPDLFKVVDIPEEQKEDKSKVQSKVVLKKKK